VDHSVFLKYDKDGNLICTVGIYVDNIILASDSLKEIGNTKRTLSQTFKMTDLGEISWILGMEVKQDRERKTMTILQEKYINNILERYGQLNVHPMTTLSLPNEQLVKLKSPKPDVDIQWYQSAVGTLMYAMLGMCLDLVDIFPSTSLSYLILSDLIISLFFCLTHICSVITGNSSPFGLPCSPLSVVMNSLTLLFSILISST